MSNNLNEWEKDVIERFENIPIFTANSNKEIIDVVKSEIFKAMQELISIFNPDWEGGNINLQGIKDEINSILESRNIKEKI
jgi:hypothetical protein